MSTAKFNTLQTQDGLNSIAVERVIKGACAAWVNFNGTGTVAIRAAYNVSSITDNGTGDYTVNFTTAMPDVNYGVALTGSILAASATASVLSVSETVAPTASQLRILSKLSTDGSQSDRANCNVAIFR